MEIKIEEGSEEVIDKLLIKVQEVQDSFVRINGIHTDVTEGTILYKLNDEIVKRDCKIGDKFDLFGYNIQIKDGYTGTRDFKSAIVFLINWNKSTL